MAKSQQPTAYLCSNHIHRMQHITLSIEESRYDLLLQFLSTLDYVRVVPPPPARPKNSRAKRIKSVQNKPFLAGMKTTDLPVGRTILNREEIYGNRV